MSGYWGAENLWSAFLEADARALRQHAARKGNRYAEHVVAEECKKSGVSLTELRSGSRRGRLSAVRAAIVRGLVENYGVAIAEVARQVGISTSGVSKILSRTFVQLVNSVPNPVSNFVSASLNCLTTQVLLTCPADLGRMTAQILGYFNSRISLLVDRQTNEPFA